MLIRLLPTQFAYDEENRLKSRTDSATTTPVITSYVYDGQGGLAKKTVAGATTVYVSNLYEKNLATGAETKYFWFGGRRVAMRQTGSAVAFLLADHLGSTSTVLDFNGNVVSTQKYYPYGHTRADVSTANPPTDKLFTGHQREQDDMYFMQARFYDPVAGRFLQPDSIVPDYKNPQALNRYSYVNNNPLGYVDPTGRCGFSPTFGAGLNNLIGLCGPGTTITASPRLLAGASGVVGLEDPTAACQVGGDYAACPFAPITGGPGGAIAQQAWRETTLWAARTLVGKGSDLNTLAWSFAQRKFLADYRFDVTADYSQLGEWAASRTPWKQVAGFVGIGLAGISFDFTNPSLAGHVFSGESGHLGPSTTNASRARFVSLAEGVASDPANYRPDYPLPPEAVAAGVRAYAQEFNNGQLWAYVRDEKIIDLGVNELGNFR